MLMTEVQGKSTVDIPDEIIEKLGITEGEKMEIYETDGIICLVPIITVPECSAMSNTEADDANFNDQDLPASGMYTET
jgi:AbrB family looped-hinge helix DNA binding protein